MIIVSHNPGLYHDPPALLSAIGGTTSQQSGTLVEGVCYVLTATTAIRYAFGANPTATSSTAILPLGVPLRFVGDGGKVACIHADGSTQFYASIVSVG